MPYRVGQTATNPKTGQRVVWTGTDWVSDNSTSGTKFSGGSAKMSQTDEKHLNTLSDQSRAANETGILYDRAKEAINTLNTGPGRGRFLEIATPEENGGILDTLGAIVVGGPARLVGAITPKETEAFQQLRGLQAGNVLTRQLEQKGPQTESDAARLMLTEISPSKGKGANMDIIRQGNRKVARTKAYNIFAQKFASKWGLHGTSPHGYTLDELWRTQGDRITDSWFPETVAAGRSVKGGGGGSKIRVLSRTKVK